MKSQKSVIVNNKGMITIPAKIREKYNLQPGSEVSVLEIDGNILIIPIVDPESLRKVDLATMAQVFEKHQEEELELEK
jgi:AbrB family looped-hinge helix DNA binding protein